MSKWQHASFEQLFSIYIWKYLILSIRKKRLKCGFIFLFFSSCFDFWPLGRVPPLCSPFWQYYSTGCSLDHEPTSNCVIFFEPWETQIGSIDSIQMSPKLNFTRSAQFWFQNMNPLPMTILSHRLPFGSEAKQTLSGGDSCVTILFWF